MLDGLKEDLLNIRKNLERNLIRTVLAGQSHATTENRKQLMKQMEKTTIDGLKNTSSSYLTDFTTSAKGKWVKQAKQTFEQTTEQFNNV